jgi:predicted O-linked N-acetylglucosamine transferase (SPINDLY family)
LREYRDHLNRTRETNPLFDTAGFTRDWEALLLEIYDSAARSAG